MILSNLVITHFFYNFILNNHVSALFFVKNKWIYWRPGGDVSDDVTTTKARRVNYKMF